MLNDFLALFYPRNCIACGNSLYKHEDEVCNDCYLNMPKLPLLSAKNPVEQIFYGRVQLVCAYSFYIFQKKGRVQKLLHAIKYKGNKELAVLLGKWFANDLLQHELIKNADYIIPVPLHDKKKKMRGYNQSEEFAKGIAQVLDVPCTNTFLLRREFTTTQTKKSKYERWENVEDVFELSQTHELSEKHIILVDDVITTGATIEACCRILNTIDGIKISVLSIAFAER